MLTAHPPLRWREPWARALPRGSLHQVRGPGCATWPLWSSCRLWAPIFVCTRDSNWVPGFSED